MALTYLFINYQNAADHLERLNQFRDDIYAPAFPDENEREPFDEKILPRLQTKGDLLQTAIVLAYDGDRIVGGEITDWYPSCASLEIIYLAVAEALRGQSFGSQILKEATVLTCQSIVKEGIPVEHIYFETENPSLSPEATFDTEARLRFFANAGAALLPFPYAQPPLSEEQGWARNLYLCVLPFEMEEDNYLIGGTEATGILASSVMDFLHVFYEGLGYANCAKSELEKAATALSSLQNEDGEIPLVFFENPKYKLYDVAIASYYNAELSDNQYLSETSCPVFNSYECDLMNYRHQRWEDRPFTNHHQLLLENVVVTFPSSYHYSSEGSSFHYRTSRRSLKTDLSINISCRRGESSIPLMRHLLHLVLRPSKEGVCYFSELDMLKFIVYFGFGSKQENVRFDQLLADEGLQIDTSQCEILSPELRRIYASFEDLLASVIGLEHCETLGTGVSELELSAIDGPLDFNTFDEFRSDILSEGPLNNDWNKTLCGLVLGIFDFERMNGPEIYDTIRPVLDRKYAFAVLCRGHLVYVKMDLEPERVETILMSPYLLIPGAALAFNEDVIIRNWEKLEWVSSKEDVFRKSITASREKGHKQKQKQLKNELLFNDFYNQSNLLALCISEVSDSLADDYMADIFQYPSERILLQTGSEQRGLTARRKDMMEKLENYKEKVNTYREKYTDNVDTIQNLLLFILAVMQVITAIMQEQVLWITTSAVIVLVCAFGMQQIRKKRKM